MPPTHKPYPTSSNHSTSTGPPMALTALGNRIRSLQRSEPNAKGVARSQAMQHLTELELRLERLALSAQRPDSDQRQIQASVFTLAEELDQLAGWWPRDVTSRIVEAGRVPTRTLPAAERQVA